MVSSWIFYKILLKTKYTQKNDKNKYIGKFSFKGPLGSME